MSVYQWRGQNIIPVSNARRLYAYDRFYWSDFVDTTGQYNFLKLKESILSAVAGNMKFAFRVRPMGEVGQWFVPAGTPAGDWNNVTFLNDYGVFLQVLSAYLTENNLLRYIGWIDVAFGSWGEGANAESYTDKTLMRVVDNYLNAFPETRLLIPAKTRPLAIYHFFANRNKASLVGIRIDNFGGPDEYFNDILPVLKGMYCTGEFRNPDKMLAEGGNYTRALTQVKEWNALVGNGNLPVWNTLTTEQKVALLEIATRD